MSLMQERLRLLEAPGPSGHSSFDLEQFRQSRKFEGHLARFFESENVGVLCRASVRPAVKYAEPVALGILDRVAILQFQHLPRREAAACNRAGFRHKC